MHVDGSSTSVATGGVVLITPEKAKLKYAIKFGFKATNNEAEYESMITGLRLARELGTKNVKSRATHSWLSGKYKESMARRMTQ